ncbi:autotransporter-like protein [Novosphingobium sp. PhB165]|uniref:autotransporter outer membrane beta-barrel domain-containing protein n=1 Tax=Novosphingobium sp. PhB165 TaxID=2485105 RepID=UPI00104F3D25|nr:autotransporter outer membrane beta-barrel domain-containing protein [Novosphingobium sp. PhB165]TCM18606.1 autotransporter-like protein [Novosphingobium sp. PhB165]
MSSNSRVALAASVSALAIVLSAPAFAVAPGTPGVSQSVTGADVQSTLVISNVGDDTVFGEDLSGSGNVSANVTTVANGSISQVGTATGTAAPFGNAQITLTNSGSAQTAAKAVAVSSESATAAGAQAYIATGIDQQATGNSAASASLTNSGTLGIGAQASATATDTADAYAHIDRGFNQQVSGQDAAAAVTNSGTFQIGSVATAVSTSSDVYANANIDRGSYQVANGESATVGLENSGTFDIRSVATAEASGYAEANAHAYSNVSQVADGGSLGSVTLANSASGILTIGAQATASGSSARAEAGIGSAVYQNASAADAGGSASVAITNDGSISIAANAAATAASSSAYANAYADGIYQYASATDAGGSASAAITNAGSISIAANAAATAASSSAYANAYADGIYQQARGNGADASVSLANTGTLTISAVADTAAEDARTNARIDNAFRQDAYVYGDGDATVDLTNAGDLGISLSAGAAGTYQAIATAAANTLFYQSAEANGAGNAQATLINSSKGSIAVDFTADAKAESDNAFANAYGDTELGQRAYTYGGNAEISLSNQGAVAFSTNATALSGTGEANSNSNLWSLINQNADVYGSGTASVVLDNSGSITSNAAAVATGSQATAQAGFNGIYQNAYAGSSSSASNGDAAVALTNASSGSISLKAEATATGTSDYAQASSYIGAGVAQWADANEGNASAQLSNAGLLSFEAAATADAAGGGSNTSATAYLGSALYQEAYSNVGDASVTLKNSGTIAFSADANLLTASAGEGGTAQVYAGRSYASSSEAAVSQDARGATASANLANTGTIDVSMNGGFVGVGAASVQAIGIALSQDVHSYDGNASATLTNAAGKTIHVASSASGEGNDVGVNAFVGGVSQRAEANGTDAVASLQFTNAGTLDVGANANAAGEDNGVATALAYGVVQGFDYNNGAAGFANSGTIKVATIAAASNNAIAQAYGYSAYGNGTDNAFDANFSNNGTFNVSVSAQGSDTGFANAVGASISASEITGNITNSGKFTVAAQASAEGSSTASAVGISMQSGANTAKVTNSGTINVSAITNGGLASAAAIQVTGGASMALASVASASASTVPASVASEPLIINNNGGVIVARQSVDGGTTFTHGLAIDTTQAANPVEINLTGKGSIYGNIALSADDVINVSGGETAFDGVVNPSGALEGQLNIANGGALYLVNNPSANPSYDGPAKVYVDSLNIAAGGKLAIQLPELASGATSGVGIVAQTANIAGAVLEVRPTTANGLYANTVSFNDVIDANVLTGKFGSVVVAGGSPLLKIAASYDGGDNVDLTLTRVAFGAVAGLTTNEAAVGNGIENVYNPTSTGAFATLLGNLFTLDAADYSAALEQLSGSQYATYLQSLTGVGSRFNSLLSQAGDCAATAEDRKTCRAEGTGRIWGQTNYGRVSMDGDVNARGYNADDWYMALGADFNAGANTVLGVGAAYVKHDLNVDRVDNRFGGRVDSHGFQVGAYGAYDPGQFYVKGAVSYTDLTADARRLIVIGTMSGMIKSKPDANIWALSGEAGYRFELGKVSTVAPYALVEYTAAKLKSFTETGVDAANLDVSGSNHNRAATVLGAKWAGSFGGIVPQLDLGWRHQFGGRTAAIDAAFDIAPGSDFTVVSPLDKRDTAMVGVSVSGKLSSSVDLRVGYQGRFSGTAQSNAGGVEVKFKF